MYGSKHRTTDGLYENRKDGSGYSSTKREWNLQTHGFNDDSSSHRKYIRTQSSSNNRSVPSSSSSQQQRQNGDKEKKTVKDSKKPLRVSGDWSEFKSSTGKIYYYNCKTEISQWEKPKGWSIDESSSSSTRTSSTSTSTDRTKKESTNSNISSTVRSRHKVEESPKNSRSKYHQNGDIHPTNLNQESLNKTSNNRLPSPNDDSSGMSFSSTSSKESTTDRNGSILHSSLSEPVSDKSHEKDSISINGKGNEAKSSINRSVVSSTEQKIECNTETESPTISISKAERDQEIQKYYRGNLIHHLTDWPSTQLEKQCLKLFDDYYGYSAKMSTAFIELKALKSNFRVLEIKRNILTQKLLRCQQHIKEREDDKLL